MHLLITGSSGFVGSNLVPYLQERIPGLWITKVVRKKKAANEVEWQELSERHLLGVDAILHMAGKAHDTNNAASEQDYFDVNFELTKKLYQLYRTSGVKKFIYFSSVKAAADSIHGSLSEEILANPLTAYGKSKRQSEEFIISGSPAVKSNYYILRPCMIHGPGNKGNLNLLFNVVSKGIPYPLASYANRRSFLSIENLCFVILKLLQLPVESGIYNVADDEPYRVTDIISLIANEENKKAWLIKLPPPLVNVVAAIGDKLKLPLNKERLKKLTEEYVVSNSKIKKALGIDKMPVSSKEGLVKTIRSFKIKQGGS
jgi:nucleoside-diphosphate-sugar epimerase